MIDKVKNKDILEILGKYSNVEIVSELFDVYSLNVTKDVISEIKGLNGVMSVEGDTFADIILVDSIK